MCNRNVYNRWGKIGRLGEIGEIVRWYGIINVVGLFGGGAGGGDIWVWVDYVKMGWNSDRTRSGGGVWVE